MSLLFISMVSYAHSVGDLLKAPPSFMLGSKKIVPVDFQTVDLKIQFAVSEHRATGTALIRFNVEEAGYPMLDLMAPAISLRMDGQFLPPSAFAEIADPTGVTHLRMVDQAVSANSSHTLEILYELKPSTITFSSTGVRFGFFMADLYASDQRGFLEQYAPSNFEFDSFAMTLQLELLGATKTHQVFTNGKIVSESSQAWTIEFPSYFTTSSFYMHLTEQSFQSQTGNYQGLEKQIPVTVYADSSSLVSSAYANAQEILGELEKTYGPFAHDRVVIYITPGGGGMEYCGATVTSLWALGHELTHSWFARGVMPANGDSGWMDEAIASWRDNGYPSSSNPPSGSPVNMANFSPFQRMTNSLAYTSGATLLSQFDSMFSNLGGLKVVLRRLFSDFKRTTITTPMFQEFLETQSLKDLDAIFQRYVYGKNVEWFAARFPSDPLLIQYHRPYTQEELEKLR